MGIAPTPLSPSHPLTTTLTVDLGGSLAVASRGLFATGVSTDLNVTYLSSGGKIGDLVKAEVTCDKCKFLISQLLATVC
jgi:acyl-coenzyme A thioesterase 13